MSEATLPGNAVPNAFFVDHEVITRLRSAAVTSRKQFGSKGRKVDAPFRMSELGDVVGVLDADGQPSGCPRKVAYSFHAPTQRPAPDADAALNFERGDLEEAVGERYLKEAGLLAERHVRLGAWDPNNRDPAWRADPRYPDRSGGRWRGDIDFVINHPTLGIPIPLDWKSTSSYAYKPLFAVGPTRENSVQVAACAYEMRAPYYSLGYVEKETGQLCVVTVETPVEWIERVLIPACDRLRRDILDGNVPPRIEGARKAAWAEPPGSRYSGNKNLPDDPFFDKARPCYTYGAKKDRAYPCQFYEACWGEKPPERPAKPTQKKRIPVSRKKKDNGPDLEFS